MKYNGNWMWCVKVMVWFAGDGIVCEGKVLVMGGVQR